MASNGATIHDVAAHAGVSIATVSRVIHLHEGVSPGTRTRVLESIRELNYTPNESGRALANRKHDTLAFVVPGLSGPFFGEIIQGCSEQALAHKKAVLVLSTHMLPGANRQIESLTGRVDGLAILGGTISSAVLAEVKRFGKPMVLVSQHPEQGIPTVRVDNRGGTIALTRHLIETHGYRDFAFAGSFAGSPDAEDRWAAFRTTLIEAGVQPPRSPIPAVFDFAAGADVATTLLQQSSLPDVLVCGNDQVAIGTIAALNSHGVRVPEDMAITGWDGIEMAAHTVPALTTVRQPMHRLGTQASTMLLAQLSGDVVEADVVLPTDLVLRESCGCRAVELSTRVQERSMATHD